MSLNIQSLSAKYSVFRDLILELGASSCLPDVICLQEVWTVVDADLFPLPGYQPLIFKTRATGQGGGGRHLHQDRPSFQNLQGKIHLHR